MKGHTLSSILYVLFCIPACSGADFQVAAANGEDSGNAYDSYDESGEVVSDILLEGGDSFDSGKREVEVGADALQEAAKDAGTPLKKCPAGSSGTVDHIKAQTAVGAFTRTFIGYDSGTDYFSESTPIDYSFAGSSLPAQVVAVGNGGIKVELFNGITPQAATPYKVDMSTLGGIPDCASDPKTQTCLSKIAKSYRCKYPPYLEIGSCPVPAVTFTAMPATSAYTMASETWQMVLVDLSCH